MNIPGKPGDKPDGDETTREKPSSTDPPTSELRPSVAHPVVPAADSAGDDRGDPEADAARREGDGRTVTKGRKGLNLKAKDANDVHAPPPDIGTRLARLAKRDWHGKIIGWHTKTFSKLQEADIQEIFQTACVKALEKDDWPAEEKPTLTWLFKITRNTCYDYLRALKRRRDREVPLDDLDVSEKTQAKDEGKDLKNFIEVTLLEKPNIVSGIAMLVEHHVIGNDVTDIAAKHSIPPRLVYERMASARAAIRSGYQMGGGLVAALALLLLLIRFPGDDRSGVGAGNGHHPHPEIPLVPVPPLDAAEMRTKALELCHEKRYAPCLEGLNRARKMDPAGEKDPKVIQARQEAEAKMRE